MSTYFKGLLDKTSRHGGSAVSLLVHVGLMLIIFGGVRFGPKIAPYRMPGTKLGVTTLTYYSPGSFQPVSSTSLSKSDTKRKPAATSHHSPAPPKPEEAPQAKADTGIGTSAKSGLGEGDITIALQTYFPYPTPDLSSLPHGTKGDVILNAVIDQNGKISELTVLKSLGGQIDRAVIATVQQWSYTPAKRNGVPVTSEQELHFHYERS